MRPAGHGRWCLAGFVNSRTVMDRPFLAAWLLPASLCDQPPLIPVPLRCPQCLGASASNARQLGLGTFTGDASGAKHKFEPAAYLIGHDAAATMRCSQLLFFQVSYLNNAACVKSSNYCLVAVSCPLELSDVKKQMLACSLCIFAFLVILLLMLAGDVELNRGPMNNAESTAFKSALGAIETLQWDLKSALLEFKGVKEQQAATNGEKKKLIAKFTITVVRESFESFKPVKN